MAKWTADDISQALGLTIKGKINFEALGISIDSRTLKDGEIFLAIQGENFDGHDYLQDALEKGAAGFIISKNPPEFLKDCSYFIVADTLDSLWKLARYARKRCKGKIIAVTGSAGKTTTKEWFAKILGQFGSTVFSPESYNNHWGVPLSLTKLDEDTRFGIFEVGMNHEGEIEPLSKLVRPDAALVTAITEAHIGYLRDIKTTAYEKSKIFSGLVEKGFAVLNASSLCSEFLAEEASLYTNTIIEVGKNKENHVQLVSYSEDLDNYQTEVHIQVMGEGSYQYTVPLIGEHFVMNTVMIFSVLYFLGLESFLSQTKETLIKEILTGMEKLIPISGRGVRHTIRLINDKSVTLIDDSYNAHPTSMQIGLKTFGKLNFPKSRRIAVLGEMLELGENSEAFHHDLLPFVYEAGIGLVYACGPLMKNLYDFLPPSLQGAYKDNADDLWQILLNDLENGDIVYIKGSKGSKVYTIANRLLFQSQDLQPSSLEVA